MKLVIIGAGPKALAIAAKGTILHELGFSIPAIHIVEKSEIGANWIGSHAYTNGKLSLGTSPEKDIGFPYNTTCFDAVTNAKINQKMLKFSWQQYLIDTCNYADWIDRNKPPPTHYKWANYLKWVSTKLSVSIKFHYGCVDVISFNKNKWLINFLDTTKKIKCSLSADGLVLTGPGKLTL